MTKLDIYDWREDLKPIWAVLKPEWRWLAMDKGGAWYLYKSRPKPDGDVWVLGGLGPIVDTLTMPTPDCPWDETLTERPEGA